MIYPFKTLRNFLFLFLLLILGCTASQESYYTEADYKKVDKADVHVHIFTESNDFMDQAIKDNFKVVSIALDGRNNMARVRRQFSFCRLQKKNNPAAVEIATAFSMEGWDEPNWLDRNMAWLDSCISNGAIAVKVWKNIGMVYRDKDSTLIMIDNPRFDPIFKMLADRNITVIGHLGEPKNCWMPLEEMTTNNDSNYFRQHPEYHMYQHPDLPSYEEQIAARDRMLEKNPDLVFIGAHLGSLEWDVKELAKTLDRFPNMAVDMAARMGQLFYQTHFNRDEVRAFFIKYQDRLLYATDMGSDRSQTKAALAKELHETWYRDWLYFVTDKTLTSDLVDEEFQGLKLPQQVVDKIYYQNAKKWLNAFSLALPFQASEEKAYYSLEDFYTVKKIDGHVHIGSDDPGLVEQAIQDNFYLLSINTEVPDYPALADQENDCLLLMKKFPGRISYLSTFETETIQQPGWDKRALSALKQSFANGAVGIKVWKNIGMVIKDRNDQFIQINHAVFDPVFDFLVKNNKTVMGHIGEPRSCWLPLDEMVVNNDKNYFARYPEYHMYLHPENPSYEQLIGARDSLLAKHPSLTFVGAHLGSMEWSIDMIIKHLDQFPNLSVDLTDRICYLQHQSLADWQKVHDFFIEYQDRILYGTDIETWDSIASQVTRKNAHEIWLRDWKYFTTDEVSTAPAVNGSFKGLKLPKAVIDKIYYQNAVKAYPGLLRDQSIVHSR